MQWVNGSWSGVPRGWAREGGIDEGSKMGMPLIVVCNFQISSATLLSNFSLVEQLAMYFVSY